MKKALFAGSFDPITLAHLDIIEKSKNVCDNLIIGIAKNSKKTASLFTDLEKKEMIESATKHLSWVGVTIIDDLTSCYAQKNNVAFLIRGISAVADIHSELVMATTNRQLTGIETVFIVSDEKHAFLSSSQVRELASYGHNLHGFVPQIIEKIISSKNFKKNI
jgi:pantetheine-phosphate adenylyltransferase